MTTIERRQQSKLLARRFAARVDLLKSEYIDRDDAVDIVALATLCREHVLLIGPPGTAKTALLTSFGRLFDTEPFSYLLTRFTEPTELFGPVNMGLLKREDKSVYEINTDRMLPQAHLAFLDEVFEGSSAILNALLTLINERVFHNGSVRQECNLITLLGASNELPDDPVLAAFSDRFLLRCSLGPVAQDLVDEVLRVGWSSEQAAIAAGSDDDGAGSGQARFSLEDLGLLQQAIGEVDVSPIRTTYADIVRELRDQGVMFSDRRAVKAQKAFAASALLDGRTQTERDDLLALVHLWTDPRDEETIRRALVNSGIGLAERLSRRRDLTDIRLDVAKLVAMSPKLHSVAEQRDLLRKLQRYDVELRRDHPRATELLAEIKRAQRATLLELEEQQIGDAGDDGADDV